jgi:hypothetical protein
MRFGDELAERGIYLQDSRGSPPRLGTVGHNPRRRIS